MRLRLRRPALCLVLASGSLAASDGTVAPAGDGAAASGQEIIVSAQKQPSDREWERTARKFVAELGKPGPIGQVSRWGTAVCARVDGLTPALDRAIARRIDQVAGSVGAPKEGPCADTFNAWVVFTTEPGRFAASVARRHPILLGYHHLGERKKLATFQPPMKSWYVTSTTVVGQEAILDQAYSQGVPQGTGSHIKPLYQSRFGFVLVVVDANAVDGQEIAPVADRIAMMVLANAGSQEGCRTLPSIMDFLASGCSDARRDGLTEFDQAYLRGLYGFDKNEIRSFMRDRISHEVAESTARPH